MVRKHWQHLCLSYKQGKSAFLLFAPWSGDEFIVIHWIIYNLLGIGCYSIETDFFFSFVVTMALEKIPFSSPFCCFLPFASCTQLCFCQCSCLWGYLNRIGDMLHVFLSVNLNWESLLIKHLPKNPPPPHRPKIPLTSLPVTPTPG